MERRRETGLKTRETKVVHYFDFTLLFLVFFVCMVGLIIIYSSSAYIAQGKNLPSNHFLKKQFLSLSAGTALMIFASFVPYRFFLFRIPKLRIRISTLTLIAAYILQLYVLFFVKEGRNGSTRWIEIPGFGTLQPSEISKFAIVLFTSMLCYKDTKKLNRFWGFLMVAAPVVPLIIIIGKENLSSAIIALIIFGGICFVTSKKYMYFVTLFFSGIAAIFAFEKFGGGYRLERFRVWRNPEAEEKGYQILQGLYAIASGGIFGKGLGNSAGKYERIPEAYNDMIFTVICEELGLIGAIAILMLYVFIVMRLFVIALNAPDLFGTLITVGVMTQIATQVILNVAVVTNRIPSTGITLPFISYGGSSVLFLLGGIGVVLNISKSIKYYA